MSFLLPPVSFLTPTTTTTTTPLTLAYIDRTRNRSRAMGVMDSGGQAFDRAQELKQFEESKLGVKGLLDSGLASLPPLFIHPPKTLSDLRPARPPARPPCPGSIPTIDLSGCCDSARRPSVIGEVACAACELGFLQVVNHGVPAEVLDCTIVAVKAFHEQLAEAKARIYRRQMDTGVSFFSNVDLFLSKAASWRDTLQVRLGPKLADTEEILKVCRNEVLAWNQQVERLGSILLGLLSEGLGLSPGKLQELTCLDMRMMVGHYYPYCPQPDLTVGLTSHADPGVITVLLQDQVGGLQVKHGDEWVDVKPVLGALVVNIGDIIQIMSNDEYKSIDHRVLANPSQEPRVSIAVFCNPSNCENEFGPFPELVSLDKPAAFRQFTLNEYMRRFFTKELDGKSLINYFRA
ncbi:1-aminocyclopropane-1-carboxylate oxidase homolog 4-like [Eucalyptus grandis]|uniref:1-aminocyclopropane-1-carboxylate oxidase homolog 4-like n=1 Tax=Eucalyptus grandis TaxID=71139 RepID=UPI00192E7E9B|nr:1-aminocyclopropane-1-carboxylate oxidase homolog 4-like [Eucalyptus grandis]